MGGSIAVGKNGMGGSCNGLGACIGSEGICRNGAAVWASFKLRLWANSGMSTSIHLCIYQTPLADEVYLNRLRPNLPKKPGIRLTLRIPTLAAMLLEETKRGGLRKTIRQLPRTCKQPDILATQVNIQRMSVTSLKLGSP